jgi:hypothetical protein
VEGLAHDERAGTDQRRIPAPHKNASESAQPSSGPALLLGLLRSGQVQLRKIDGWDEMAGMEAA